MIAGRSGTCPVCGKYIAASRSHVSRLSVAIPPQRPIYRRDSRVGTVRDCWPRRWVHTRCYVAGEILIANGEAGVPDKRVRTVSEFLGEPARD
jgi:hypothetical protein